MTFLRSALATLALVLVGLGGVAAVPAAAAPATGTTVETTAEQGATTTPQHATTSGREETLALVAAGAGLLIAAGLAGGAWRSHRDPRAAALGH